MREASATLTACIAFRQFRRHDTLDQSNKHNGHGANRDNGGNYGHRGDNNLARFHAARYSRKGPMLGNTRTGEYWQSRIMSCRLGAAY
jgi:hypothetical protein